MIRTVMVVEDDDAIRMVLRTNLEDEGYRVLEATTAEQGLVIVQDEDPDVVLVDLRLPGIHGLDLVRSLRATSQVPIIIVTAQTDSHDVVAGLEAGADDYVTKPFSPAELVSRVKAVLRRTQGKNRAGEPEPPIQYTGLRIDPTTREVTVRGTLVDLTATEFNLLWFMASHPRQVFNRAQLLESVWGFSDYVDPSTVTVHIRRLREKIEADPSQPACLQTMWGVGYKFEPPAAP